MQITIDSLQRLYALILALALTESLKEFSKQDELPAGTTSGQSRFFKPRCVLALISVIVLIIPFFHGMNLYLERTYVNCTGAQGVALLVDVMVFMTEAAMLFLMSRKLHEGRSFYLLIAIVLAIDTAWGLWVHVLHGAATVRVGARQLNLLSGPTVGPAVLC